MTVQITISIERSNHDFLKQVAGNNKSAYINELLYRERCKLTEEAMIQANDEAFVDSDCIEDMKAYELALSDGLVEAVN
jgi:hypothetical protein